MITLLLELVNAESPSLEFGSERAALRVLGRELRGAGYARPEEGVSAILELAHQIESLFELNDPERGVTVNVGTIDGGLRPNFVAPEAFAAVDARAPTSEAAREVDEAITSLTPTRPGLTVEVEGSFGRPPIGEAEVVGGGRTRTPRASSPRPSTVSGSLGTAHTRSTSM
jgi:acetylornithine deacetylase/succinyl-diaminopimelate desuccinylase-like protein